MSNAEKSREELIAEIEVLKRKLASAYQEEPSHFTTSADKNIVSIIATLSDIPELIAIVDRNGKYCDILNERTNAFNSSLSIHRGKYINETMSHDIAALLLSSIQRTIETGTIQIVEYTLDFREENRRIETRIAPFPPRQSIECTDVIMAFHDVTERRRSHELLRIQRDIGITLGSTRGIEKALQRIVKIVSGIHEIDCCAVFLADSTATSIEIVAYHGLSQSFVEHTRTFWGDSPIPQIMRNNKSHYVTELRAAESFKEFMRRGELRTAYFVPISSSGAAIGVLNVASRTSLRISPEICSTIDFIAGQLGETAAHARAIQSLHDNEQFLMSVFSSIQDGISVLNSDLTIMQVNPVMERWYARNMPLAGKLCYRAYHDRTTPCENCPSLRTIKSGLTEREIVPGLPGLPTKWLELFSFPIRDERSGTIRGVVEFVRDITEIKRIEEEREELEMCLRQSEKMQAVGQLAGGIAHDFNNQLTGIMGCADLIKRSAADNSELAEYAGMILKTTRRAADLTAQLLAFARKGRYLSIPVSIHAILDETISLLSHSIDKRIGIEKQCDACSIMTTGDPGQLQNAMLNIGLNARDAITGEGTITFKTQIETLGSQECRQPAFDVKPGEYACVSITDTGSGIDESIRARIFEPFFTTKPKGEGSGMGLAAVYGTVKSHNGMIAINSEPGRGTEFKVYFPLYTGENAPDELLSTDEIVRGTGHILLVDDEEVILSTTRRALADVLGYSVVTCTNGRAAVELYKNDWRTFDLVILDMIMPGLSGRDTFDMMRTINPGIKALIVSGYSINREAREMIDNGISGIVSKPFRISKLSQKIAEIIRD